MKSIEQVLLEDIEKRKNIIEESHYPRFLEGLSKEITDHIIDSVQKNAKINSNVARFYNLENNEYSNGIVIRAWYNRNDPNDERMYSLGYNSPTINKDTMKLNNPIIVANIPIGKENQINYNLLNQKVFHETDHFFKDNVWQKHYVNQLTKSNSEKGNSNGLFVQEPLYSSVGFNEWASSGEDSLVGRAANSFEKIIGYIAYLSSNLEREAYSNEIPIRLTSLGCNLENYNECLLHTQSYRTYQNIIDYYIPAIEKANSDQLLSLNDVVNDHFDKSSVPRLPKDKFDANTLKTLLIKWAKKIYTLFMNKVKKIVSSYLADLPSDNSNTVPNVISKIYKKQTDSKSPQNESKSNKTMSWKNKTYKQLAQEFFEEDKKSVFSLRSYLALQNKDISLMEALIAIINAANGRFQEMRNIIFTLKNKDKFMGPQAYRDYDRRTPAKFDLVRNSNGEVVLTGYDGSNADKPSDNSFDKNKMYNPNLYTQKGTLKQSYKDMEAKLNDIGKYLKLTYPDALPSELVSMLDTIKSVSASMHYSPYKIIELLKSGRLEMKEVDGMAGKFVIRPVPRRRIARTKNESVDYPKHRVIFSEAAINEINEYLLVDDEIENYEEEMTFYAFKSATKRFLGELLKDPVNAKPNEVLLSQGLNRSRFLAILERNGIIIRDNSIVDKDENGNPITAEMSVKFKVPKKDFDRKMHRLYIKLFEKNLPPINKKKDIEEDGDAGGAAFAGATSANVSAAGSFVQPLTGVIRRKPNK